MSVLPLERTGAKPGEVQTRHFKSTQTNGDLTEMASAGLCCANLEEPKALMKMGLSMVLIGHVNFLLGALVHGVVLRHINLHKQARAMEYAISNVIALTSGLVGIVVGILAIVLSKNKKSRGLTWSLFAVALAAALTAAASAIGLSVSVIRAIIHGGRSLLTHCRFPDAIGYSSVTNECPFDPTRIYSTTLILWVPLIVTCLIQMVFSARCFSVCLSFLGLPCCPKRRPRDYGRGINVVRSIEEAAPSRDTEPLRSYSQPPKRYTEPSKRTAERPPRYGESSTRHGQPLPRYAQSPTRYGESSTRYAEPPTRYAEPLTSRVASQRSSNDPKRQNSEPPKQHRRPPPPQYRSLPPSERQPLRQPSRERSEGPRVGSQERTPEQHHLLERGTLERSSFWI